MKSSLCHIKKQTTSLRFVGLMLTITSLGLMLPLANRSAQAQTSADVSSATTSAASSPADWTQFHRDNMQRWNPFETALGVKNANELKVKWSSGRFTPEDDFCASFFLTSVIVANGVAYYGSEDGALQALNVSNGTKLWSLPCQTVVSTPAVANGVLYFISGETDSLEALNARTGARLWSYGPLAGSFSSGEDVAPTVVDGVVYFCGGNGDLYALNARSGALLWRNSAGGFSSPAVANGIVYVGAAGLSAFDAKTGARLWASNNILSTFDSPAVWNGMVYFGFFIDNSSGYGVAALDAKTGAQQWIFGAESNQDNVGQIVLSSPAIANGVLYIGSEGGTVFALDAFSGALKWAYQTGGVVDTSPAVANGVVYITDSQNDIALSADTGKLLWSYPITNAALPSGTIGLGPSSPAVVDGVAYFLHAYSYFKNGESEPVGRSDSLFAFSLGADLFLRAQPSATTVHQGDLITYAFPVWNLGPANAVHEVLNTQVPAGTTFNYIRISGTPGLGTCMTPKYLGTGQIICHENASMAPNTTWTVRLTVRVTAPSGTVITENAATLADTPDPNPANNTAIVSIKVQ